MADVSGGGDTGLLGGIGAGLSSFADSYQKQKQLNMQNQTTQAGLLSQGYEVDPSSGQLTPTEEKKNQLAVQKAQTQYQLSAMDPNHEVSKNAREQYTKLLKTYQPGSESLISPDMSKYQIENDVLPKLKMLNDMSLESKLKALDIATKQKELAKPDEGAAAANSAFQQIKAAHETVAGLDKNGYDPTGAGAGMQGLLPSKFMQSPQYKQEQAAEDNFVGGYTAWRKQRGENPEAADVIKGRYFAQPGEDAQTKANKDAMRDTFVKSLEQQSGQYAKNQSPTKAVAVHNKKLSVYDSDVVSYAKAHGISNQAAQMIKMKRTAGSTASKSSPQGDGT